jgi:hypothetical protein
MARKAGQNGIQTLVIDTENKFVSTGFAEEIAKVGSIRVGIKALRMQANYRGVAFMSTPTCQPISAASHTGGQRQVLLPAQRVR